MAPVEKMVSADPGTEFVPGAGATEPSDEVERPVVGGLEAEADNPRTAEPIHPDKLVGERPATGSNANPG